jgi:hypothetical protein
MASIEIDGVNGVIKNTTSDADIFIKGNDGGSEITALTFDISAAGAATFNSSVAMTSFAATAASTITTADNTDTLTLISTDTDSAIGPNLNLYRNAGNGADADNLATVAFAGNDDAGNATDFYRITAQIEDASNGSEDVYVHHRSMVAGTEQLRMSLYQAEAVFNDGSADIDFRVESNDGTHALFVDAGNNVVIVGGIDGSGTTPVPTDTNGGTDPVFQLQGANNANNHTFHISAAINAQNNPGSIVFSKSRDNTLNGNTILQNGDRIGEIIFCGADGTDRNPIAGKICADVDGTPGSNDMPGRLEFHTTGDGADSSTERMRILSSGELCVRKTSTTFGTAGSAFGATVGEISSTVDAAPIMYINRLSSDGNLVQFHQASTHEGTISVSGNTVSYSGFTGTHWSRLSDNSKPTILRGTIMDSIDEMCDWYQAVADVAEVKYTAEDEEVIDGLNNVGDVKMEAHKIVEPITLPNGKSVGDDVTFTSNSVEYTGTIIKEDDVKHTKSKVSDTADSKKVYGVFSNWDDADDGLDGDVNDMNIAQVGTYIIRVNKDVTVEAGDLLVSNGDGTAKKQDDDIIRSKTVAKVNSNIKVETYSDGSYTVPCTLHC